MEEPKTIGEVQAEIANLGVTPTHIIVNTEVAKAVADWLEWWDSLPWWRKALHRAWWAWCDAVKQIRGTT